MSSAQGVSPLLSIGGLSGSLYFSTSVNEKNVSSFAQAALAIAQKYQLNGLEFEYVSTYFLNGEWSSFTQLGVSNASGHRLQYHVPFGLGKLSSTS